MVDDDLRLRQLLKADVEGGDHHRPVKIGHGDGIEVEHVRAVLGHDGLGVLALDLRGCQPLTP